jgi:ankyrin repeat protein
MAHPSLSDLPNELLQAICETLTSARDISALSRTCQQTFQALILLLYRFDYYKLRGSAVNWAILNNRLDTIQRATSAGVDVVTLHHLTLVAESGNHDIFTSLWTCKENYGGFEAIDKDDQGVRPFDVAVASGRLKMVEVLLSTGKIDIEKHDEHGHTPLHAASHNGDPSIVALLLQHGADVNAVGEDGRQPLTVATVPHTHFRCARSHVRTGSRPNFLETLRILLRHGAEIEAKEANGRTALHEAVKAGHCDAVDLLASHGADVNTEEVRGHRPLHTVSLYNGKLEMAKLLVRLGSDVAALSHDGRNPLWMSRSARDKRELTEFLLAQGAKFVKDKIGNTPLHDAVGLRCAAVAELMLDHGADINASNKESVTPIHRAAEVDRDDKTVKLLIERGADVSVENCRGETALGIGIMIQPLEVIELLLKKGANPNSLTRFSSTVLHEAVRLFPLGHTELLLHYGADPNQGDKAGQSPLFRAANMNKVALLELLVKNGAKIDAADYNGQTTLAHAVRMGAVEAAGWLAKNGANVNSKDNAGEPILHRACQIERSKEMIALLLRHGAKVNATDNRQWTALHVAANEGRPEVIKQLLRQGADWEMKDTEGNEPLFYARSSPKSVDVLKQWVNDPDFRHDEDRGDSTTKRDPRWLGTMKHILRGPKSRK